MPAPAASGTAATRVQADDHADALSARVENYLSHLAIERRLSGNTVENYRRDLLAFVGWMRTNQLPAFRDVRAEQLRSFMAGEHRRGLSAKSLQRRLSALRSFFRHLLRHDELPGNPVQGLRAPKAPRKLPQVLDADEMTRLVEVPAADALGRRDRAMLELFYSSGLRLSELCGLRWRELDLAEGLVRVTGKGGKTRLVPVGSHARAALEEWKTESTAAPEQPVFPGRGGLPISPRSVQQRVRLLAQQQGIWKRVHPHLLRHSFASHVLESSGDLRGVQELLGHADIATTQIYTHLDFQHLAKVYDSAHPRARRKP